MQDPDHSQPPLNPLPPAVLALAVVLMGIELMFDLGEQGLYGGPTAVGWRNGAISDWGFSDPVFQWMLANGRWPIEHLARFVTYPLIHYNFTDAVFAVVILLAIGKRVGEMFGNVAFLTVFWVSSIVGALVFALILDDQFPLAGAFPGVYGEIGALSFVMFLTARLEGTNPLRAFTLIGFLMGLQLFFKLTFGGPNFWLADLGGFCTGFGLGWLVSPLGQARIRQLFARLRQR